MSAYRAEQIVLGQDRDIAFDSEVHPTIELAGMTRDMDLIRELLLRIEADPKFDGTGWIPFDRPEYLCGRSPEAVAYHISVLNDSGLIKANTAGSTPAVSRLTWDGHEFLDNIKDSGIWKSTKEKVAGLSGVALSVIRVIAEAEIKKKLHLL